MIKPQTLIEWQWEQENMKAIMIQNSSRYHLIYNRSTLWVSFVILAHGGYFVISREYLKTFFFSFEIIIYYIISYSFHPCDPLITPIVFFFKSMTSFVIKWGCMHMCICTYISLPKYDLHSLHKVSCLYDFGLNILYQVTSMCVFPGEDCLSLSRHSLVACRSWCRVSFPSTLSYLIFCLFVCSCSVYI